MIPILYTDSEGVRSVIGVDDRDIPDEMLSSRKLDVELLLDLSRWLPNHASVYSYLDAPSPTDAQVIQARILQVYSQYYCALLVSRSTLPLAAAQQVGDGKNALSRFTPFNLQALQDQLAAKVAELKQQLTEAVTPEVTAAPFTQFVGVGQDYDPVIGPLPVTAPAVGDFVG